MHSLAAVSRAIRGRLAGANHVHSISAATCTTVAALLLAAGGATLAAPEPAIASDGTWWLIPEVAPSGRALAYDTHRQRMLLFGGSEGLVYRNEVWTFSLADPASGWTLLSTEGTPPAGRVNAFACYDPGGDRMILVGGEDRFTVLDDMVWQLSLTGTPSWSELAPLGTPPPYRVARAMAFDAVHSRVLLFGGTYSGPTDEIFVLSLAGTPAWTQIANPGGGPGARYFASAAYDASRDRFVVFGGVTSTGAIPGDAWVLSLDPPSWQSLGGGGPTYIHSNAVNDPGRDRLIVYDTSATHAAWALPYSTQAWEPAPELTPPATPGFAGLAYDPVGDDLLLAAYDPLDGVWRHPLQGPMGWIQLAASDGDPGARFSHSLVLDAPNDRLVLFGGRGNWQSRIHRQTPVFGDVLVRTPDGPWQAVTPSGPAPTPRHEHSAILDPARRRMIVFGGQAGNLSLPVAPNNEVWVLSLDGPLAWQELTPAGTPPAPRWGHTATYDAARDRMIVFGGAGTETEYADTWALSLSGTPAWTLLAPTPPQMPPLAVWGRVDASAAWDPVRDQLIVVGGSTIDGSIVLGDQWTLDLTGPPAWTPLETGGTAPGALRGHAAFHDAKWNRMLVFGGGLAGNGPWELRLAGTPEWRTLTLDGGGPRLRRDAGVVFDAARDQLVVVAGRGDCYLGPHECVYPWRAVGDAWIADLESPAPIGVPPAPLPPRLAMAGPRPNPARGDLVVAFGLADDSPARLEVFDVSGRRVAARDVGSLGAGSHAVRLAEGRGLAPGVYAFRVTQGGHVASAHGVVTR
jgi:hypothetical protein